MSLGKYCMPAEGVPLQAIEKILTNDEIYHLSRVFVEQGIRKIRLTGGEPTVRKDIVEIIGKYFANRILCNHISESVQLTYI